MRKGNHLSTEDLIKLRAAIRIERRLEASERLYHQFANVEDLTLSFASFGTEIDLWPLNHLFIQKGCLALPRVEGASLALYRVEHFQHLTVSKWGILEPIPEQCEQIETGQIRYIFVPGLAFDRAHHRKGYGKGYYDRFLCRVKNAQTIGLGFKEQLSKKRLKIYKGDVPLDSVFLC